MTSQASHDAALRYVAGMDVPDAELLLAVVELAGERARVLVALLAGLSDDDEEVRLRAARGLGDPRAGVAPIVTALARSARADVDLRVRAAAADALAGIGALGALADVATSVDHAGDAQAHRSRLDAAVERARVDGSLLRAADVWWAATPAGVELLWNRISAARRAVTMRPREQPADRESQTLISSEGGRALTAALTQLEPDVWQLSIDDLDPDVDELLLWDRRLPRAPVRLTREPSAAAAQFTLDGEQVAYVRAAAGAGALQLLWAQRA